MSNGARVAWALILAELRRSGEFPRVYVELREHLGCSSTASPYKYVRELVAAGELVRRLPAPATRPAPWHRDLNDDDFAIMADDRELDGDLGARGIAEAWQA